MKPNEMILYLIGQITKDKRTYDWRRNIRTHFDYITEVDKFEHGIKFFDPCDNNYSREVLEKSKSVEDFRKYVKNTPQFSKVLPVRDMNYVFSSDGAICNMTPFTPEKPFIGTFYELSWYMTTPWKPVIGIYPGDYTEDLICMHPFVQDSVTTWVQNTQEACELVEKLFL
ncbi:MAG: hypothetical protein ACTSX1_04455 [Candidatus Heimdallarchaeaceae archaeon]